MTDRDLRRVPVKDRVRTRALVRLANDRTNENRFGACIALLPIASARRFRQAVGNPHSRTTCIKPPFFSRLKAWQLLRRTRRTDDANACKITREKTHG